MTTPTTVDAIMILAMLVMMFAPTKARPVRAPMLITPATMTATSRLRRGFWKEFGMRARPARESGPH
eukprot:3102250-Pyramimonas_sp.AAC.1